MTGAQSWLTVDEPGVDTDGVRVLRVAGELDLATIGTLRSAVGDRTAPGARVALDLERLTFCDSTGLGAIVGLYRRLNDVGGVLALCAPGPRVVDVFRISGVDQVIAVYPSAQAARRALAAPA
jgi:anti-sigma B factor antagonist